MRHSPRIILVALMLAAATVLPSWAEPAAGRAVSAAGVLRVREVVALCRSHPTRQSRLWVRGYFLPDISAGYLEGGLFDSPQAIPLVAIGQQDKNGPWKRYGALYAHIGTHASFGLRWLTLHGLVDCSTFRFRTDKDPFPAPRLKSAYGSAQRGQNGPASTWVVEGGLKLTLTLPRRVYPRNALVRVGVSIRNVSKHELVYMTTGASPPGFASPQAEVLDSSGRVEFPPAMPYAPPLPGPAPAPEPLGPGQTVSVGEYIVLRGARVRASQPFFPHPPRTVTGPTNTAVTRPLTVRLTAEQAPELVLHRSSQGMTVDVVRPPNVSGKMLLLSYADCGAPFTFQYTFGWVPSGTHLVPGCSPVQEWHLRVAWPNHPVAALDYVSPQPTPAPPPPTPTPPPTSAPSPQTGPSFDDLLLRAGAAMASVHTLHAVGVRTSQDPSAQLNLHIQGDCRSSRGKGMPVALRTLTSGWYRESTRPAQRIDEGYILMGPVLPGSGATARGWERSAATQGRWRSIDVHTDSWWEVEPGAGVFAPDPAYLNQICPAVIQSTYLAAALPYTSRRILGTQMLGGHKVWHLREHLWAKLDLYVDAASFRLRRLVLWDRPGPAIRWQIRFDYSRFKAPLQINAPNGRSG